MTSLCKFGTESDLVPFSEDESWSGKANDEGRKIRAFGSAGVSPAVLHTFSTMQTCRRDAGATKNAREMSAISGAEILVRNAGS